MNTGALRDVVELMADLIIVPVADQIMDATYSCYDGACGTGGHRCPNGGI